MFDYWVMNVGDSGRSYNNIKSLYLLQGSTAQISLDYVANHGGLKLSVWRYVKVCVLATRSYRMAKQGLWS